MTDISNTADIIDLRDIIEAFEAIEETTDHDEIEERNALGALLDELNGAGGGDEQWRGDWYPVTLIRDSYFTDYAMELADDICDDAMRNVSWPLNCIDWEQAARELRMDYSAIDYGGVTYWWR